MTKIFESFANYRFCVASQGVMKFVICGTSVFGGTLIEYFQNDCNQIVLMWREMEKKLITFDSLNFVRLTNNDTE
jgi:hypothetical protein